MAHWHEKVAVCSRSSCAFTCLIFCWPCDCSDRGGEEEESTETSKKLNQLPAEFADQQVSSVYVWVCLLKQVIYNIFTITIQFSLQILLQSILGILIVIEVVSHKIDLNTDRDLLLLLILWPISMPICKLCLFEDCIRTCAICNKHQPNILSPVKVTRNKKENHFNWINSNSCKNWVHPKCSGLTKKENIKIEKLIKEKKIDYYFKCVKCCLKSIITSGILQT